MLGLCDGKKLLPCCEDCHAAKKKPLAYGKADQPVAQAAKRARKAEERTESAAKRRTAWISCQGPHPNMHAQLCLVENHPKKGDFELHTAAAISW